MLGVGDDDTPPKTLYRAFRRPITEGDRAAAAIAQSNELLTSLGGSDPTYSDGRLVAGTPHDGIFAVPMPDDTVCSAQLPIGGGGCGSVGYDGLTADFSGGHDSDPLQLYGLAGDEIEGVDVVVAGVPQAATMGENGYRLTVRGRRGADIDRIILHLRSGERQVFELSAVSVDG